MVFYGDFKSKADVCREFSIDDFAGVVIYAEYETGGWEGYADILFVNDGKFYLVSGSHCSCHGLENQWNPAEMSIAALHRIAAEPLSRFAKAVKIALGYIEDLNLEGASETVVQVALKLALG